MKKIKKIIVAIIIICLSIIVVFSIYLRIFKITAYEIKSESMSPTYKVGDLIYTFPIAIEKLKVGDVISYYIDNTDIVVTHRIVEIDKEKKTFYTKGDNENLSQEKMPVSYNNIIGVVEFSIPFIGKFLSNIATKRGKIIIIGILLILLILILLNAVLKKIG